MWGNFFAPGPPGPGYFLTGAFHAGLLDGLLDGLLGVGSSLMINDYPIGSMYGIYANIWGILMVNVTIYGIHGSYGYGSFPHSLRLAFSTSKY